MITDRIRLHSVLLPLLLPMSINQSETENKTNRFLRLGGQIERCGGVSTLKICFCVRQGITGGLLEWIKSYLSERTQFTVLNGVASDLLPVTAGIPQGSVLGPTLFTLFTNDLPSAVRSGSLFMYADDTSIFCIGQSADLAIALLNKALQEVYRWCLVNRLTPHPGKSEVMIISKKTIMGPLPPLLLRDSVLRYVTKTRLLGMTVTTSPGYHM